MTDSKTQVKKAGQRIRNGSRDPVDMGILQRWRARHIWVLNTFQANIRKYTSGTKYVVGQRLKRQPTIIDKLVREPRMQLTTMHDIAGCRVIFPNMEELTAFRSHFNSLKFHHKRRTAERDQFNYVRRPKSTGYRGVHDVWEYSSKSKKAMDYKGLLIELQYRTVYQHAWATAIEVVDLISSDRIKFNDAEAIRMDFFRHASEIIARAYEDRKSCLPALSNEELTRRFKSIEGSTGLLSTLKNLRLAQSIRNFSNNMILMFFYGRDGSASYLEYQSYKSNAYAERMYRVFEEDFAGVADVVLVRAKNLQSVREVFKNYFADATEFVKYVELGIMRLNDPQIRFDFYYETSSKSRRDRRL